jgi:hypothetical protein
LIMMKLFDDRKSCGNNFNKSHNSILNFPFSTIFSNSSNNFCRIFRVVWSNYDINLFSKSISLLFKFYFILKWYFPDIS